MAQKIKVSNEMAIAPMSQSTPMMAPRYTSAGAPVKKAPVPPVPPSSKKGMKPAGGNKQTQQMQKNLTAEKKLNTYGAAGTTGKQKSAPKPRYK